jgi:hypothetical protein
MSKAIAGLQNVCKKTQSNLLCKKTPQVDIESYGEVPKRVYYLVAKKDFQGNMKLLLRKSVTRKSLSLSPFLSALRRCQGTANEREFSLH